MDFLFPLFGLFSAGCFGIFPTALAAAAIVDIFRVRAPLWWICGVLFFPVIGPLAYFVLSYAPIAGMGNLSPASARRQQARRRLKEIQIQLQHWRGPALLADAGDQLLTLGDLKQAEALLREAKEAGAEPKDVNFPLAQVLQVKGGRWAEARPLLDELLEVDEDARFGSARLALARCLDELGETERAEEELRRVLKRRDPPEAKVRLARLLLRRGGPDDGKEAAELLANTITEGANLPKYLRKEHGAWLRQARKVKATTDKLPAPRIEGVPPRRSWWMAALLGLLVLGGVLLLVAWVMFQFQGMVGGVSDAFEQMERLEAAQARFDGLEESHGALTDELRALEPDEGQGGADEAEPTDIEEAEAVPGPDLDSLLHRFVALRRTLEPSCQAIHEATKAQAALREKSESGDLGFADIRSMTDASQTIVAGRTDLAEALAEAMDGAAMAPSTLLVLLDWVDGRFLVRDQAKVLGLPEHFRSDYMSARFQAQEELPSRAYPDWREEVEKRRFQAQAKLEDFETRWSSEPPAAVRPLLDARRQELEASLDPACVEAVIGVIDEDLNWLDTMAGYDEGY